MRKRNYLYIFLLAKLYKIVDNIVDNKKQEKNNI